MTRPPLKPEFRSKIQAGLHTPIVSMTYSSSPTPDSRQSWQSNARMDSLYTATHLCAVQVHQACGKIFFFPALLLQFLVNHHMQIHSHLCWHLAWSGRDQVKGHPAQPSSRRSWHTTYDPSWPLSLWGQTHTHNQVHRTHQDGNIFFMFLIL